MVDASVVCGRRVSVGRRRVPEGRPPGAPPRVLLLVQAAMCTRGRDSSAGRGARETAARGCGQERRGAVGSKGVSGLIARQHRPRSWVWRQSGRERWARGAHGIGRAVRSALLAG